MLEKKIIKYLGWVDCLNFKVNTLLLEYLQMIHKKTHFPIGYIRLVIKGM